MKVFSAHVGHCREFMKYYFKALLCDEPVLDRGQGVVDLDEVLLTVVLQVQSVEVQSDPVTWLCSESPLQEHARSVRLVGKTGRLHLPSVSDWEVKGLHWKHRRDHM